MNSINKNIFKVLSSFKIKTDLFVHDIITPKVISTRAKDNTNIVDKSSLLTSLDYNKLFYDSTNQEEFDNNFDWEKTIKYGCMENNYNTHQNAIRQLYSLKKLHKCGKRKIISMIITYI